MEEEEEGEEVEGLGQAETYSDYMPSKCMYTGTCTCILTLIHKVLTCNDLEKEAF